MNEVPIIELNDVTVPLRRDAEAASVEGATWTVGCGEFWVVGGLHGAGMNDLVFMLAGLTKPLSGGYRLFGQDMGRQFGEELSPDRRRAAVVFDDARLFSGQTVAENVALPILYHQEGAAEEGARRTAELMQAVEVTEFAEEFPSAVTGAWRRRVALARALAAGPEVLLLENPLRGLDARHAGWWLRFLRKLWRGHPLMGGRPMTLVAAVDEFRPWRECGARFALIEGGRFKVMGDTAPKDDGGEWTMEKEEGI